MFKKHLEKFAAEHKNDIKSKPAFRAQFQQMCARIGVDPLACELYTNRLMSFIFSFTASKGFWAQMLGVGDFYYEVSN